MEDNKDDKKEFNETNKDALLEGSNKEKNNIDSDEPETLGVENDIRVILRSKTEGILFDQDCCTCINIILNDDGEIATSFLGVHSEDIIKSLWKAQKAYFKALKRTLKEERKRGKEILDEEDDTPKVNSEEYIHHIKEYEPSAPKDLSKDIETNKATKEKKLSKTKTSNKKAAKVVNTDTPKSEHLTTKKGKNLAKKQIK